MFCAPGTYSDCERPQGHVEAVELSCAETGLLIPPETAHLPAIDSDATHVDAVAERMTAGELAAVRR